MRSKRLLTKIVGVKQRTWVHVDFALGQKGYFSSSSISIPFIVLKSVCFDILRFVLSTYSSGLSKHLRKAPHIRYLIP